MEMDSTTLEDFKLEVIGTLYTLTRETLIEICNFLDIECLIQIDLTGKSRSFLISVIVKHLNRDEVEDLEDGGMAELLMLRDKISESRESIENRALDEAGLGVAQKQSVVLSEQERLMRELEAMKLALKLSLQENPTAAQESVNTSGSSTRQAEVPAQQQTLQTHFPFQWSREFKISGQIGEPGQKEKLSFSSLAHQIEQGISKGFPEPEIVDAVIRAIAPGLQLRSYLEGKPHLTLPTLRRILRFHYQEKGATELYKQLTSEVQSSKESPQNFVIRALDLRQKILFASQEADSALKYDPILVQSMFLHTVLTGLQNDSIRSDLLPYLQQQTCCDELLLEKLNIACANEAERQNKRRQMTQQRLAIVHSGQASDESAEKRKKDSNKDTSNKIEPTVLNELREVRSDMAVLKTLAAEVAQIKESIRQSPPVLPQHPPPPVVQEYVPATQSQQQQWQNLWPPPGPGVRGDVAQYQQRFARQHYQYPSHRARQRRCFSCYQNNVEYCTHCYRCGSGEHFLAGCRVGVSKPENHLNERGLPPRDRE
ncbi:uncharacterized protein LOC117152876 [Anabas testudineus]|uniref:uncharacterized protein LOC117152876 n=1 Tax=Anabas testudineus TaxID=64144 RepID=UPI00143DB85E|nr:uncharacterized protein LOC117152876 [Anabas testudineus]